MSWSLGIVENCRDSSDKIVYKVFQWGDVIELKFKDIFAFKVFTYSTNYSFFKLENSINYQNSNILKLLQLKFFWI